MTDTPAQRDFALEIVQKLRAAGFEALWAGGCVRDQLLGIEPKDYDVATSALPEAIRDLFGRRRTLAIGAATRTSSPYLSFAKLASETVIVIDRLKGTGAAISLSGRWWRYRW